LPSERRWESDTAWLRTDRRFLSVAIDAHERPLKPPGMYTNVPLSDTVKYDAHHPDRETPRTPESTRRSRRLAARRSRRRERVLRCRRTAVGRAADTAPAARASRCDFRRRRDP
jgi:hypothetical protein